AAGSSAGSREGNCFLASEAGCNCGGNSCLPTGEDSNSGIRKDAEGGCPGSDCDHRVRADYPCEVFGYSTTGMDQLTCFASAELSRRGSDPVGNCQRGEENGQHDDAD